MATLTDVYMGFNLADNRENSTRGTIKKTAEILVRPLDNSCVMQRIKYARASNTERLKAIGRAIEYIDTVVITQTSLTK